MTSTTKKRLVPEQRFGALVAIRPENSNYWRFRCDCGYEKKIKASNVRSGLTKSCGCEQGRPMFRNDQVVKHGLSQRPEYRIWTDMIARCTASSRRNLPTTALHPGWRASFEAFFEEIGPRPSDEYSLARVNNNNGFVPGNVVWRLKAHRDVLCFVEYKGERMPLSQLCRQLKLPYNRTRLRVLRGWSLERALMA